MLVLSWELFWSDFSKLFRDVTFILSANRIFSAVNSIFSNGILIILKSKYHTCPFIKVIWVTPFICWAVLRAFWCAFIIFVTLSEVCFLFNWLVCKRDKTEALRFYPSCISFLISLVCLELPVNIELEFLYPFHMLGFLLQSWCFLCHF